MELHKRLATLRKEKGLSQLELAESLNVSRQAISRWEVGTVIPTKKNLLALSELYEVPLNVLLSDEIETDISSVDKGTGEPKQNFALKLVAIFCIVFIAWIVVALSVKYWRSVRSQGEGPVTVKLEEVEVENYPVWEEMELSKEGGAE